MSDRVKQRQSAVNFASTLQSAQCGSVESLGSLLDACRQYLLLIANQELTPTLTAKVGPSDLVQDTFLAARRDFSRFHGATQAELLRWLRRILLNHLRTLERRYLDTEKRSARRELSLEDCAHSNVNGICDSGASPSRHFMHGELQQHMAAAFARLPQHYQQIIELRQRHNTPFDEIARQLTMTPDAARQRWARAIKRLRKELRADESN